MADIAWISVRTKIVIKAFKLSSEMYVVVKL